MQPWRVYVVAGAINDSLADALVAASRVGVAPPPAHFPEPLPEVYRARAVDFGARYYASLGIERSDSEARGRQTERNYSIFPSIAG
jgi:hypothetical protein